MIDTISLSEVCEQIFTGLPPRLKALPGAAVLTSFPLIGIRAITSDGQLDIQQIEEFSFEGKLPKYIRSLVQGDVLMTIRGSNPKAAIVESAFNETTYPSGNLAVLRADQSKIVPSYLWSYLSNAFKQDYHPLLTRATTQQLSIRMADLTKLKIPYIPMNKQRAIGNATLALRNAVITQKKVVAQSEKTFVAFLAETFCKL